MPRIGATLSLLLALTFISLAFAPVAQPVRAETDWGVVGGGAAVGAASGALIGTAVADGPGALAGAIVGGVWGAIAGWMAQDNSNAALLGAQAAYTNALADTTENYLNIAKTDAQNEIANYEAWTLYYARKAEWAALKLYQSQVANGTTPTYEPYKVLTDSEVANGTLAAAWHIAMTYEAILNSNKALGSSFVGTYEGMRWGYKVHTDWEVRSTASTNNPLIAKVLYWIDGVTSTNNNYGTFSAGTPIFAINPSASAYTNNITITARGGTVVYSEEVALPAWGVKLIDVPKSGEYNIKTNVVGSGAPFKFYAICGKALSSSYTLTANILCFTRGEGESLKLGQSNNYYSVGSVLFWGSGASRTVSLNQLKADLNAIRDKTYTMLTQANNFAQAYFNTLVSDGGGDNRVMPDVIFPDPDVLANMTAEELQATYLAYLRNVQSWFSNYSVMDPGDVYLSQESLNLKVRGAMYHANGNLMYDNLTVFTPYVSLSNMNLVIGNNTMTQPGFAIKWGSASSLADFMEAGRLTDIKYIQLSVGDYFIIEEMMLDNEPVTKAPLTVHTVQYITIGEDDLNPITPPQGATDLEWLMAHWYWFAIIAGAIFVAAWAFSRNTALGAIGLILVGVGAVFWIISDASVTTGLLSGLFRMR